MGMLNLHGATAHQLDIPGNPVSRDEVHSIVQSLVPGPVTIPVIPPDHTARIDELEKQLSDVCDFANRSLPMLCETIETYGSRVGGLEKCHNEYVDAMAKDAMDLADKIDGAFDEQKSAVAAAVEKIHKNADTYDKLIAEEVRIREQLEAKFHAFEQRVKSEPIAIDFQGQIDELTVSLNAHKFAIYITMGVLGAAVGAILCKVVF